ncbi:tRNA 5-methoxyuridine(34)/uridine 5-oxyacetic acid(34) synthase CmoB [Candidatus Enterovibrio altilux]|uniref:tRNA U34 carboxymethyltransferase n=1 Tax=Candidatus Enterovibrio altilux TaxID=1927128 RepID=A0A291B724_9GAMM|nr:tRNA 5-methoxyuridine(34)/uridine 5-oxyacetic acid(34) synthase CmoB [Candidatus Enterovibrio luxaltus]ATF08783.1 tRNA (5-methoxyuridine) 34 synthase [Candidatus Enterovibrio luxaltus]
MFDFSDFYQLIAKNRLQNWLNILPAQLTKWQSLPHRDMLKWMRVLKKISTDPPSMSELKNYITIGTDDELPEEQRIKLKNMLHSFHPWRKGPYRVHGINIDTEWRSDWKWNRVLPHISPLKGRYVLDVGCGNGYHMWRMLGEGAELTIGIDPSELFLVQFEVIRRLMGNAQHVHLLPLGIECLPKLKAFDTVFSMGVLHHRRSPLDHLIQLKSQLVKDGELVLETLVIEGGENEVLVPIECYAKMRNVYFCPSAKALKIWLKKMKFIDVRIVDECATTTDEQRTTKWMTHHSLPDYLDTDNPAKTVEGYPAPKRAILIAKNSD